MSELSEKMKIELEKIRCNSAWAKGVKEYSKELIESYEEHVNYTGEDAHTEEELKKILLNGADNWNQYSYGACSLVYDGEIAERLCSPSQLKIKKEGELPPNRHETWLDVQTRALSQAYSQVRRCFLRSEGYVA